MANLNGFELVHSSKIFDLSELPSRLQRGFETARAASKYSDGFCTRDKMGASIFAGSRLLSIGFNQYSKSRPSNKFIHVVNNKIIEFYKAIHAEQAAIDKIKYSTNYINSKLILYVYRETAEGLPAASAPCLLCQQTIKQTDLISIVRFFTPNGEYSEWKVT